jgi:hypothetical protein
MEWHKFIAYLAGPYRSKTINGIAENIASMRTVAVEVHRSGVFAYAPCINTSFMDGVASDEHFLEGNLVMLEKCDCIIMCPGWENSAGAQAELARARVLRLPAFYSCGLQSQFLECDGDRVIHVSWLPNMLIGPEKRRKGKRGKLP